MSATANGPYQRLSLNDVLGLNFHSPIESMNWVDENRIVVKHAEMIELLDLSTSYTNPSNQTLLTVEQLVRRLHDYYQHFLISFVASLRQSQLCGFDAQRKVLNSGVCRYKGMKFDKVTVSVSLKRIWYLAKELVSIKMCIYFRSRRDTFIRFSIEKPGKFFCC